MKIAKNRAKNEIKEIQLIEKSQRDETYAPESVSPQTTELEWLQASYDKKKNRSLELGVKAIDMLIKEGKTFFTELFRTIKGY
ncbi:hypothetical protein [Paenibacillus taichungensis]